MTISPTSVANTISTAARSAIQGRIVAQDNVGSLASVPRRVRSAVRLLSRKIAAMIGTQTLPAADIRATKRHERSSGKVLYSQISMGVPVCAQTVNKTIQAMAG